MLAFRGQVLAHQRRLSLDCGLGHGRLRIPGLAPTHQRASATPRESAIEIDARDPHGGTLADMRWVWAAIVVGAATAAAQAPAAKAPPQVYTDADLHFTVSYPADLQPMDARAITGSAGNSRFNGDANAEADSLESPACRKTLLSVGRVIQGAQGSRQWGLMTVTDVGPACIPPKALQNPKRMDSLLNPIVNAGTQTLGMMSMGPPASYLIQGHKVHFAGSRGEPVAKSDLQPTDETQTIANFAVQVNDHIVSFRIEANDSGLLNRMLASKVDFGAGSPQPLFPGQLTNDMQF